MVDADATGLVAILFDSNDLMLHEYKSLLESAGIQAFVEGGMQEFSMFGANLRPFGSGPVLKVRKGQLEAAKQVLCENGVVCDVPEGGVARIIERVVQPILQSGSSDTTQLAALLDGVSKDFRELVFAEIQELEGGSGLLRGMLSASVEQGMGSEAQRRDLAQALCRAHPQATCQALAELAALPATDSRVRLARTLGRFAQPQAAHTLVSLLADAASDVRDEALESLFVLSRGKSFDFAPEADPAGTVEARNRWQEWAERYSP